MKFIVMAIAAFAAMLSVAVADEWPRKKLRSTTTTAPISQASDPRRRTACTCTCATWRFGETCRTERRASGPRPARTAGRSGNKSFGRNCARRKPASRRRLF